MIHCYPLYAFYIGDFCINFFYLVSKVEKVIYIELPKKESARFWKLGFKKKRDLQHFTARKGVFKCSPIDKSRQNHNGQPWD